MEPQQIKALKQSLATVLSAQEALAVRFHQHMRRFEQCPRPLFTGAPLARQGVLLTNAIAICASLPSKNLSQAVAAGALSQYHASYGIASHHFHSAADALALALKDELGHIVSDVAIDAWAEACRMLGQALWTPCAPMAA
jgi:hemoglobin-like flavoprotein